MKPAVAGGFTLDDSIHDPDAGTLKCPAGSHLPRCRHGYRHLQCRLPWLAALGGHAVRQDRLGDAVEAVHFTVLLTRMVAGRSILN